MPARRKRTTLLYRAARIGAIVIGIFIVSSVLLVLPLRWIDPPTSAFMLADKSGIRPLEHDWTDAVAIADSAVLAVVAAEDQRFAVHFGFDVDSIRDSIADSKRGEPLRGASTITQQVAKNLYLWSGRSLARKGLEAWFTILIELFWPKQRIVEIYLNLAEFGPGVYGVGAASRAYFGKPASALTDAEAALLAAVLPSPKRMSVVAPSDYLRERQRWILGQIERLRREQWLRRIR